jgi:catechol 2,3-dioxygenase-like lactoylglutathione lyase family enzyme
MPRAQLQLAETSLRSEGMKTDYAITFFYYEDIAPIARFYEDTLAFELVLDQGLARIYRVAPHSYFGIVDGNRGHLRHQPESAALFTIVAEDVAGWHAKLKAIGVSGLTELQRGKYCDHFFFRDPGGYALEIQRFHDPAIASLFR